jgi:hypothetical protein
VGGSLKLNLIVTSGIITLPALFTGLKPVIPVIVSCGLHVLFKIISRPLSLTHFTPGSKPNSFGPFLATNYANFKLS